MYKLWYYTENGGDGDICTRFYSSKSAAVDAEAAGLESWEESRVDSVDIHVVDGKPYLVSKVWEKSKKKNKSYINTYEELDNAI